MWRRGFVSVVSILLASGSALAQTGTIVGRVTTTGGLQPIVGARVTIVGTSVGATTRDDGSFKITTRPGRFTVRAARIGFLPDSAPVTVAASSTTTINLQLQQAATVLSGQVVVGYGEQRARDLTGSVASVSAGEFNTGRIVSPEQLIQAKVPGVQVIGTNEPGGGINIRVRGGSSVTSSNEPLFVVDGVPLDIGGGTSAGRDPLNFINPSDIENITVLKDASATAIYGSRGANGVVLITTKSGKEGAGVSYTGSVSRASAVGSADVLSAAQFRAAVTQYAPNNVKLLGSANTNWLSLVERNATGQQHDLAISNKKDDMYYRLSLGYLDQDGVLLGSNAKRISTSASYFDQILNHTVDVQVNLKGSRNDDLFTPGSVLGSAIAFDPTQSVFASPGVYYQYADALAPVNPLAELALVTDKGTTYRGLGNIKTTYHAPFMDGLSGTVNLGYDNVRSDRTTFYPSNERSQVVNSTGGSISRNSPTQTNTLADAYATYSHPIGETESHIELTAGYSYQRFHTEQLYLQAQGLSSNLLGPNGIPAATTQTNSIYEDRSLLVSQFARVNYSYRDRYLLSGSIRRDGSSKFGPDNQYGTFPSIGLGWRVIDESFMKRFPVISDLKLRYSYGVNGNQAFPSYQAYSSYTIGGSQAQYQFGNQFVTTIRPSAADPQIKWEQTTSNDIGLDYGMFGNRITGTIDYYKKTTKDLIFNVPIAAGTNLSNFLTTNIGSLQDKGLELGLNARLFDSQDHGFTWTAGFTASTNSNRLLRINPIGAGNEQILTGGIAGGVGSNIEVLQPGFPINSFFVYRHRTGANGQPVTGDTTDIALYQDINKDSIINQSDRVAYKNPAPKWIFGHTSQMTYGNFDASFTLRAYTGNYVYNNVASNLGHYSAVKGASSVNLQSSVLKYGFVNPQYFSDLYIEDGSFLKMDNMQLGYTVHALSSVRQVRIFGAVQNVFMFTHYSGIDPEAGINGIDNNIYPRARTFTFGTNIGF